MIKTVDNLSIEGIYLNIVKTASDKFTNNFMLDGKTKTESFPCKIKKNTRMPPLMLLFNTILNPL